MTERDRVEAFVEDVLARARIPGRRERDDVRRELLAHFDDAVRAHGSIDAAMAAFGFADEIGSRFRGIYRAQRLLAHVIRIAAGLAASIGAALAIELAVSRPAAFRSMAGLACLIVLVLAVCHELRGRPPRQSTPVAKARRWAAAFLALAAWEYGVHHHAGIPFGLLRAAAAGGVLVTIAAATTTILAGADRAFTTLTGAHEV